MLLYISTRGEKKKKKVWKEKEKVLTVVQLMYFKSKNIFNTLASNKKRKKILSKRQLRPATY